MASAAAPAAWAASAAKGGGTARRPKYEEDMLSNLVAMFASCDETEFMRDELMRRVASNDRQILNFIVQGWDKCLENWRTVQTNMGIVAALVLSVSLSLTMTKLEMAQPDEEDRWTGLRTQFWNVYYVCLMMASLSALMAIVFSIVWVNYSLIFVLDADDAVWFIKYVPSGLTDVMTVLNLVFLFIGVPFGMVVQLGEPAATICFSAGWVSMGLVSVWYFTMLFLNTRKALQTMAKHQALHTRLIDEAFQLMSAAAGAEQ